MAKLMDATGQEAVVGTSNGYWLSESDFFSTSEATALTLGNVTFPRDWPNVYTSSKPLKSLIGKKGQCAGKKVGVVGAPLDEESDKVKGVTLHKLQSFTNAESVEKATGLQIVRGWAVFEHADLAVSEAFVAERYWWNAFPDGKWVDFTPRPEGLPEMLLAEAAGDASKEKTVLTSDQLAIIAGLLKARFSLELRTPAAGQKVPTKAAAPPEAAQAKAPASLRALAERVRAREPDAVRELEERVRGNEELCIQVAGDGIIEPLVEMLGSSASQELSLKLLLLLTDAGVGQKNVQVAGCMIKAGLVPPLAKLIAKSSPNLQELAAAVLGNLCHESPANQEQVAKTDVFEPLVKLLSADIGPAQEATYAIWNLSVGHEENSAKFVKLGAVPHLTELLKSNSDIAQENAAGALMHVTMSQAAKRAIVEANAIPLLCKLLQPTYEQEVSSQAAGALLNLASDCPEYKDMIAREKPIESLVNLVKDGPDLAKEYAAGALMNLVRSDMDAAAEAAKHGAVVALASLLTLPMGHSEALGALANLASNCAERQIAIYKAQVTRKSVALLQDSDVEVRRSAAALLMNLAPHPKIKERIVEAGALKPLAAALKEKDAAILERAAGALANLFNDHSANVHEGFKQAPDMVPSLVAVLQAEGMSDDGRRQAAHALAMLAAEDGPCDAVWTAGAGPELQRLLQDSVAEAALGIMNLSWRWPEVKLELAKSGTTEHLVRMLKTGDSTAKEYSAGALMNLTAGSPDIAEEVSVAVPELSELLRGEGLQAAEWSAGALANILRVSAKVQQTAVDAGVAEALAALLPKVSSNGKTLLALALTSLTEHQAPVVQKALAGSAEKSKLREFRNSSDEELQDHVNQLIEKLGSGFSL